MSSKEKVYKTKVTLKGAFYGAIPFSAALLLAHFAMDAAHKFAPADPTRYLFVGIPATISSIIILFIIFVCGQFLGREIKIKGNELTYTHGKLVMVLPISEMAFSPPSESAMLKTIMFSDGQNFIQIPEIFLGAQPFQELNDAIKKLRRERDLSGQRTYSL